MSTINLLPAEYLQRRFQHRANVICLLLFVLVAGTIGAAALVSEEHGRNTRKVCARINAQYSDAARLIDEMHRLEVQKQTMLRKAELSAALMERLPRSCTLAAVVNALPDGAALTSLAMKTVLSQAPAPAARSKHEKLKSGAIQAATPPATVVTMVLNGVAATDVEVARFIANLAQNPMTEQVDLVFSQETRTKETGLVRQFQLTVRLKPNADALDAVEWMRRRSAERAGPAAGGPTTRQAAAPPVPPWRTAPAAGEGGAS